MEFPRKRFAGGSLQEPASSYHHAYRALQQWRNVGTASRELRRNCAPMYHIPAYSPHTAQKKSLPRPSSRHRGLSIHKNCRNPLKKGFRQPAAGTDSCTPCGQRPPSRRTVCRQLSKGCLLKGSLKALRRRGSREIRGESSRGKSIRKRDKTACRREVGHWEADTIVSGQGKSEACASPHCPGERPVPASPARFRTVSGAMESAAVPGKRAPTRVSMAFFASSIPRAGIFPVSVLPP